MDYVRDIVGWLKGIGITADSRIHRKLIEKGIMLKVGFSPPIAAKYMAMLLELEILKPAPLGEPGVDKDIFVIDFEKFYELMV